ncbi:hypothetical protein PFICI_03319 [Pestalotiopsis fici W106-1]|uniref:Uncharacterized protein n=1 Tax=Pestalotiopsis fici (strain W106-1 / CGMCC3.15140) TaxID=1229662 RepID=W3XH26_PESFW|nr:uncharacterized protein PFICI_03319 [Pestalotiopsis fici W106-1]ETS85294.1 hypothetical protein PFICI_03319 [Pestalotiopsis fici W106-1]
MATTSRSLPTGPGLLFIQVQIEPAAFDDHVLGNWFKGSNLWSQTKERSKSHSSNWECADLSDGPKHLSLWRVENLAEVAEEAGVPSSSSNDAMKETKFEMRYYSLVEEFEKDKHDESHATTHIITAGMEPANLEASTDLDKWYSEEHNEQMSLEPGWIRSRRYKLADDPGDAFGGPDRRITWMTIHEFGQGNKLGNKVEALDPVTPWTRKVMGGMSVIEANVWANTQESSTVH